MKAYDDLLIVCEEWRIVTAAETDAIHAEAWNRVAQCQETKQRLQVRILESTAARLHGQGNPPDEPKVRTILNQLTAMELQNKMSLAHKQDRVQKQQAELEIAENNLHRLHRAYAPGERSGWHSYS